MGILDLTQEWTGPGGLPPFCRISNSDFRPAFSAALKATRARIAAIAACKTPATFGNVIEALENSDHELQRVAAVFFNLTATDSNEERRSIEREIAPELARFNTEVAMNRKLFRRVETVWRNKAAIGLNDEQHMVLKRHFRHFLRSGAQLEGAARRRFAEISERLAGLHIRFAQNLLADESAWHMEIPDGELDGLPEFVLAAARQAASQRKINGHVITLDRSLIEPFLKYSRNRDLRKQAYQAWTRRGAGGGETDNRAIATEIIALRHELATLLGYESYAACKLRDEMAKTPEAARKLLLTVWNPARKSAEADAARHQAALAADGHSGQLEAWDWRYYAERLRKSEHDLDETEIKQYFQLDLLIDAAFHVANRLFDLTFHETGYPAYNAGCRVWDVRRGGQPMATFIADYFARPAKRSGAWCSTFCSQQRLAATVRPVVVNVCNFIEPAAEAPCLLAHDDARTLFHEFGHALHAMLSDVTYPSVSGTSVARDFVELPSQLFENWLETPEVLEKFAINATTGEKLPDSLRDRMSASTNFNQGFATVEYLACAFVDLDLHSGEAPADAMERQSAVLGKLGMPDAIGMRHAVPHFAHVFSGSGYAAGYYSYIWADVLAADAFEAFQEAGGAYCTETSARFAANILSAGGTCEPEEQYIRFRGKLPTVDALLRKRDLTAVA